MIYIEPEMEIVEFDITVLTMNIGSSDSNSGGGGGSTVFPTMQTEVSDI